MRAPFGKRELLLRDEKVRERAIALLNNLPVDADHPLQIVVSEYKPPRKQSQNAFLWAGPLKDIAEQAFLDGRQYSAEVWMEYFKRELLPEEFDPELCREGYRKYDYLPDDQRVMVGSSTQLTVKGFSNFVEQITAFGASLGVMFHASPNEGK